MKRLIKVGGKEIQIAGKFLRIACPDADGYEYVEDPEQLIAGLKKSGSRVDLLTFKQTLPDTSPKYSYPMEWDNIAVLPVTTYENWWKNQIRSLPRNRARQAEKRGVTLREVPFDDELVHGIWEVYNESPVRQGKPNAHYGKDVETVRRESATYLDSSAFIGAFFENKLIGFIKMTWDQSRTQANLMNIVSMVCHKEKAPTNALIAHSVKYCAEHGIPNLVYQNFSYGRKQKDSLSDFKENNGFARVDVPRYYVPLTRTGSLALRMGLHKTLADLLPESAITKFRDFRNAWYKRKFQSVSENS
jgi:hypothetical protein